MKKDAAIGVLNIDILLMYVMLKTKIEKDDHSMEPSIVNANSEKIFGSLVDAIKCLYAKDSELIRICANERLLSHWIAIYFSEQDYIKSIYDVHVDIEYNRFGKKENNAKWYYKGTACSVDMVLHRREHQDQNILCLEIKSPKYPRFDNECQNDIIRVREFTKSPQKGKQLSHRPKYECGTFVHIISPIEFDVILYNNGKLLHAEIYTYGTEDNAKKWSIKNFSTGYNL